MISTILNPQFKLLFTKTSELFEIKEMFKSLIGEEVHSRVIPEFRYGVESNEQQEFVEFEEYISESFINQKMNLNDIICYWEGKKQCWPKLYKLAMKYLCILATSCTSERLFSFASLYFEKHRTRMLPSNLENECILKSYLDSENFEELLKLSNN